MNDGKDGRMLWCISRNRADVDIPAEVNNSVELVASLAKFNYLGDMSSSIRFRSGEAKGVPGSRYFL